MQRRRAQPVFSATTAHRAPENSSALIASALLPAGPESLTSRKG